MKNRTSKLHKRGPEWVIVVRRPDGSGLYYCESGGRRGQTEWGLASQARRYESEAEASAIASSFDTNSVALEYMVIHMPQKF